MQAIPNFFQRCLTPASALRDLVSHARRRALAAASVVGTCLLLAACGGSADAPPPDGGIAAGTAPTITQQPADAAVSVGAPATFSVVADGDAPLAYQWKRGGADIAGATGASYTLAAAAAGDSGAAFTVTVSNASGSVTSSPATLTVTMGPPPVLTITQQPASTSVVAGADASFTVAGTCSSGTLGIHWQRSSGGGAFADIAGATTTTYSFATGIGDSGSMFRAALDCSGQSAATSTAATLTVTAPETLSVTAPTIVGLSSGLADITHAEGIDLLADGSFVFTTATAVKRLSADLGMITTVAGGATAGSADGPAATASFRDPSGVVHDGAGNLYVADNGNHTIRRIATDGTVSTIAGLAGASGAIDGTGSTARFNHPFGIAIGPDGDLYVADSFNAQIRRVTTAGVVTTYAGSTGGFADGPAATAKFSGPTGVAVAANGDVLVSDNLNSRVRRILRAGNAAGNVETLAGNGTSLGNYPDGVGTAAVIGLPSGMVLSGNTLVVRDYRGLLRRIDLATAAVTTITGSRTLLAGYADGTATTARLSKSGGVSLAPNGGFMLTDHEFAFSNFPTSLRSVSAAGDVRTIATSLAFGVTPGGTGVLAQMPLALPVSTNNFVSVVAQAVTVDPAGNIVVAEAVAQDVRRISPAGVVTLAVGLTGSGGAGQPSVDGVGNEAVLNSVGSAITHDSAGVLYVADRYTVVRIGTDNAATLLAGSRTDLGGGAVDGNAATARFRTIAALAVGPNGDLFAADPDNHAIRRIDPAGNVTTYAGALGQTGMVDGAIATARLKAPMGLGFTADGSLLFSDSGSLRRVSPDGSTVSTLATPGVGGFVQIFSDAIAVEPDGTVYYGGFSQFTKGLMELAPGTTTPTLLIPTNNGPPVLGAPPNATLSGAVDGIALAGPKQLVVLTGGQVLRVTVP